MKGQNNSPPAKQGNAMRCCIYEMAYKGNRGNGILTSVSSVLSCSAPEAAGSRLRHSPGGFGGFTFTKFDGTRITVGGNCSSCAGAGQ
jgi:hypothetical protein